MPQAAGRLALSPEKTEAQAGGRVGRVALVVCISLVT